jgi:hypothetical protein
MIGRRSTMHTPFAFQAEKCQASEMAMRRTVATALRMEKMTARVFCPLTGNANGGNPVTIFRLVDALSPSQCAQFARTCPWESVFVWKNDAKMAFYAPSGENMRFCAHAAMGGAYATGLSEFTVVNDDCNDAKYQTSFQNDTQIMSLTMNNVPWSQEPVEHPMALHRILRDYHQVQPSVDCTLPVLPMVMETPESNDTTDHNEEDGPILQKTQYRVVPLPTFVQATLQQRRKTLVYINSYAALQERVAAPPPSAAAIHYPRALSDQLQDSTGLYLYTSKQQRQPVQAPEIAAPEDAWECVRSMSERGTAEDSPPLGCFVLSRLVSSVATAAIPPGRGVRGRPGHGRGGGPPGRWTAPLRAVAPARWHGDGGGNDIDAVYLSSRHGHGTAVGAVRARYTTAVGSARGRRRKCREPT